MPLLFRCNKAINLSSGFSLLELLIVVSILATIAFTSSLAFTDIDKSQQELMTRTELTELSSAIRQLHEDTGFWLRTGSVEVNINRIPTHDVAYNWEVLAKPNGLNVWDPVSQRGWRGPYIDKVLDAAVITNGEALSIDGSNSGDNGDYNNPTCDSGVTSPCPENVVLLDPFGNPYVLLNIDVNDDVDITVNRNVIVSSGFNGKFESLPITGSGETRYSTLCLELPNNNAYQDNENNNSQDDIAICP